MQRAQENIARFMYAAMTGRALAIKLAALAGPPMYYHKKKE